MKTITNITYPAYALFALACFGLLPRAGATCQNGCLTFQNTVLGEDAFISNSGVVNTAIGARALNSNTNGSANTAVGAFALNSNTDGIGSTAIGFQALLSNTMAYHNTGVGYQALASDVTGSDNTALGYGALTDNTGGSEGGAGNTACGAFTLGLNTSGVGNSAIGFLALGTNTTGGNNTANGASALFSNSTGSNNIALGYQAGFNLNTGNNNIDIGNVGVRGDSNRIRIGTTGTHKNTFIAGISGVTVADGVGVIIDAHGRLGTVVCSERVKEAIRPMDKASEAILALKPVTFRYKHELDPDAIPQFGLVAEEVEKVNPDLVARDKQGKPYSVRYEAVNAMLLNEFLKEHRKVQELQANDVEQAKEIEALAETVKEQTTQIQKVRAQIQLSEPAPQSVSNNR